MRLIPQLQKKSEPSNFQFGYMNFCIEKKAFEKPKDPSILHHGQNSYATSLPNPPLGAVGKGVRRNSGTRFGMKFCKDWLSAQGFHKDSRSYWWI